VPTFTWNQDSVLRRIERPVYRDVVRDVSVVNEVAVETSTSKDVTVNNQVANDTLKTIEVVNERPYDVPCEVKIIEVEKVIEVPKMVDRMIEVEKLVEKPNYKTREVKVTKIIEKPVVKVIEVDNIVIENEPKTVEVPEYESNINEKIITEKYENENVTYEPEYSTETIEVEQVVENEMIYTKTETVNTEKVIQRPVYTENVIEHKRNI
jgi:hypothetical protein